MRFYHKHILPVLIDRACSGKTSMGQREKVIPLAKGKVLEIGIGSGASLILYDGTRVKHVTAIDPLEELWKKNRVDLDNLNFEFEYIKGSADQIPAGDGTFDTVVTTFTLCSVHNEEKVLREMHRVLKPGGRLVFSEHGKAPDKGIERWQKLVNPVWKQISGGCQLTRDIPELLERNGFNIGNLEAGYKDGWSLTSYQYWGFATRI